MLPVRGALEGARGDEPRMPPQTAAGQVAALAPGAVFFGMVLALTFTMNMMGRGLGECFAVFLLPVQKAFAASRSEITGVYSVYQLVHGLSALMVGLFFDRFGARATYGVGLLVMSAALLAAGNAPTLLAYYVSAGAGLGVAVAAMGMVPASSLISRWFSHRVGTAMGVAYAALGAGMLLLPPLSQRLIEHFGWRSAYQILGAGVLMLWPVVMLLPLGRASAGSPDWQLRRQRLERERRPWTIASAIRTSSFWGLFAIQFSTSIAAYAVLPQAVAYMVESGFSARTAADAFGFTGVLSVFGILSVGWLSDRVGRRPMMTASLLSSCLGVLFLILVALTPSIWLVCGYVLFFGSMQGARGPVVSSLTAILFPGGGFGGIYGTITLAMGVGAALGSWSSGLLHDLTGQYTASFLLAVGGFLLALASFWAVPGMRQEQVLRASRAV